MIRKLSIIAVFLLFLLPVITATLLHTEWLEWRPMNLRNHGDFVSPVHPLTFAEISSQNGQVISAQAMHDKWFLIMHHPRTCATRCVEDFFWLRQIRAAQDRHQTSIGLMLVSAEPLSDESLAQIHELAPDAYVVSGHDAQALHDALSTLAGDNGDRSSGSGNTELTHWVYLSDPMANIMMRYSGDADPNGIRRDLRRLLTWTQRD
jgi:hypothetical protein